MRMPSFRSLLVSTIVAVTPLAHAGGRDPGPAPIVQWNQLLQQNLGGPPFAQVRVYAMMHIAMADAAVAIEGRFHPFHATPWASRGAATEAAVAQAAHDVLVALVPSGTAAYDAALEAALAPIPVGRRFAGAEVGRLAAAEVLSWRQNDGSATANPQPPLIAASKLPGVWRPTASGAAQFSAFGDVLPFALKTPTQFLPSPPPQLESAEYAQDFEEVRTVGRALGANRTAEQTRFAQLFASAGPYVNVTNPFRLWDNVARDLAFARGLSLVETARLYALLSVAINDAIQTAHASKFVYRLWRPETAIDQAGLDDNPATVAEPGWAPLIVTPPYPSHSSNMTCVGMGAARLLADVFGGDTASFTARWYSAAGTVVHEQPYTSFHALAQSEADSRVWGGVHFRFELDASEVSCTQVGAWVFDRFMQPRHRR